MLGMLLFTLAPSLLDSLRYQIIFVPPTAVEVTGVVLPRVWFFVGEKWRECSLSADVHDEDKTL